MQSSRRLHDTRPVLKTRPFKTHTFLASPSWPHLTSALLTAAWSSHLPLHHRICTAMCPYCCLHGGKLSSLSCKLLTTDHAVPTATASPRQRVGLVVGGQKALHYSTDPAKSAMGTFLCHDLLTWWPHKYVAPQ